MSATAAPFGGGRTSNSNVALIGIDAAGRMYATSAGGLVISTDGLVTISTSKGLPAGASYLYARKVVQFGANIYLLCVDTAGTGNGSVWRTVPSSGGAVLTWTKVLDMTAGANSTISTNLSTDGTYLYAADYGDPVGGPAVWRSSDGSTWTKVLTLAATRHIHAVAPDPYNPGHVWLTAGDGSAQIIYRSTDNGANWSLVTSDPKWQSVQIGFTADYVTFAGDSRVASVMVWDRAAAALRVGTPNHHRYIPVPGPVPRAGSSTLTDLTFTNGSKTVTSPTAAWTAADRGREIYSDYLTGQRSWIATVNNATTITLFDNAKATAAGTGTATLGGEQFYANAYYGTTAPDGSYYCIAMDASAVGMRPGWFRAPAIGQPLELIDSLPVDPGWRFHEVFIHDGRVWSGPWSTPLL